MRDRKCNPTVTAVEEFKSIPLEFHLEQNYPNPFSNVANLNSATSISYSIPPPHPATSLVQLQIFDLLGREVKTLVRDFQAPGHYTVWWDGRDNNGQKTGAGIYIYTLRLGQQEQRKRLIKL
jgi:flagellar hook assembly protein FlgD